MPTPEEQEKETKLIEDLASVMLKAAMAFVKENQIYTDAEDSPRIMTEALKLIGLTVLKTQIEDKLTRMFGKDFLNDLLKGEDCGDPDCEAHKMLREAKN